MKQQRYEAFLPQLKALIEGVDDEISILANVAAALHTEFQWFWTGFYIVKETNVPQPSTINQPPSLTGEGYGGATSGRDGAGVGLLHLGPFQGHPACYTIPYGRGVCGTAWKKNETIVVKNVEEFPGHIACSALSRSEIVVPLKDQQGNVRAVLDIDSKEIGTFDDTDQKYLEQAMRLVENAIY